MIFAELQRDDRPTVIVRRGEGTTLGAWARLQEACARGIISGSEFDVTIHVDVFFSELAVLGELRNLFGVDIQFGTVLADHLRSMVSERTALENIGEAKPAVKEDLEALERELDEAGFRRKLLDFQIRHLHHLLLLPHGADFSVPGAGKTTVCLATYAILRFRQAVCRLVVVGPIAAFGSWKDEVDACFCCSPTLSVHGGARQSIPLNTEILLTNYNRTASDYDSIREFVASEPTQLVLDEAHRVKRGSAGVHGRAVLDLAYAACRRDVLTGTPAPQGANDLVALMKFLYPGQDRRILPPEAYVERYTRDESVLSDTNRALRRYFVRASKASLDLPATEFESIRRPMPPIQEAIYTALVGQYKSSFMLPDRSRHEMQRIGRIVMYLLEAATNPMLLTAGSDVGDDSALQHPPIEIVGDERLADLLTQYGNFEYPWKYKEVLSITANARDSGEKVIVWSNFVRNLRILKNQLIEFEPAVVHGGIPSSDECQNNVITREMEFERFRHDSKCTVLLANPAACGEGISLHHWCHHAVYLDRTFNAGHFLQSQDRIHRLGLGHDVSTKFTLLVSAESIDDSVNNRLIEKVRSLSTLMNDPDLVNVALPPSDEGIDGIPAFEEDVQAVEDHVVGFSK